MFEFITPNVVEVITCFCLLCLLFRSHSCINVCFDLFQCEWSEFDWAKWKHETVSHSVQFAFLLVLMTSKCGLHCWLERSGERSMKEMFVCLIWILHVTNLKPHDSSATDPTNDRNIQHSKLLFTFNLLGYEITDIKLPTQTRFSIIPIKRILFFQETDSLHSAIHVVSSEEEKVITIQLRKSFSRNAAKNAGEAAFVLNKSHLTGCRQCPDLCRLSGILKGLHKPALTGLNNSSVIGECG